MFRAKTIAHSHFRDVGNKELQEETKQNRTQENKRKTGTSNSTLPKMNSRRTIDSLSLWTLRMWEEKIKNEMKKATMERRIKWNGKIVNEYAIHFDIHSNCLRNVFTVHISQMWISIHFSVLVFAHDYTAMPDIRMKFSFTNFIEANIGADRQRQLAHRYCAFTHTHIARKWECFATTTQYAEPAKCEFVCSHVRSSVWMCSAHASTFRVDTLVSTFYYPESAIKVQLPPFSIDFFRLFFLSFRISLRTVSLRYSLASFHDVPWCGQWIVVVLCYSCA